MRFKSNKAKILFVGLLALTLIAVLAACGDDGALVDFDRDSWSDPFPETITVTVAMEDLPQAVFASGESYEDNLWTRRWLELYNIDVEVAWISSDYDLSMNLAIASGELPDIFHVNAVQFSQLVDADLLEDITAVVDEWSSPNLRRIIDGEPAVFATAQREGITYALPHFHWGFITQAPFLWVRGDWYAEAGSPEINTIADLENLIETFEREHGATIGTPLHDELFSFFVSTPMWHAGARGQGNGGVMWVDDGAGGIMSAYERPEMLDAIATWRDWYERGWIRQDFATADWDSTMAAIVGGETGVLFSMNWAGWGWQSIVEAYGPESALIALPLPTVDGTPADIPILFANYAYNVVRSGFAHPEILPILVSDYLYITNESPMTGSMPAEELLPFSTNEMHHVTGPFRITQPHYHDVLDVVGAIEAHARGEDFTFTSGGLAVIMFEEAVRWHDYQDIVGLGRYAQMGSRNGSLYIGVQYSQSGQHLYSLAWGPQTQEMLDFATITDDIIDEGITRIIMGLDPLEHWEVVLEDWRQAGGNLMTESVNNFFGN